jgi:ankyrin repeat protein
MARYAAEYWTEYAISAETSEEIVRTTVSFLRDETTFQRWCRLYQADRWWDHEPGPPGASRLYYACLAGLAGAARDLTTEGADVNAQGGKYGNALQAASRGGNPEIVQLLNLNGAKMMTRKRSSSKKHQGINEITSALDSTGFS